VRRGRTRGLTVFFDKFWRTRGCKPMYVPVDQKVSGSKIMWEGADQNEHIAHGLALEHL
jgi:hypothetical protein